MKLSNFFFKFFVYYPVIITKTAGFFSTRQEMRHTQYDKEQLRELTQLKKLKKLLLYAQSNIQFYQHSFENHDISNLETIHDLTLFPTITKNIIKVDHHKFFPSTLPFFITKKTTGGSTGQPVTILKSREAMGHELAATWRGYAWAGIDIGDKQARFWGTPFSKKDQYLARLTDIICNRRRVSAFSFTEQDLHKYTQQLISFQPDYFYGYVSMLIEYADYIQKNYEISPFRLKAIIATSEVLHQSHRDKLEKIFGARVYNEYGCGEIGTIAHECEYGRMHISSENMIVEVLDGKTPCPIGIPGEIIVTELNNFIMPLIRYRLGDFGELSDEKCPCGRTLPILEGIKGRAYDMIEAPDGRLFHGEFFVYIFEECKRKNLGIGAFQVIQLEHNKFMIKVKTESGYTKKTEELISTRFQEGFDHNVTLIFKIVDEISREKSGKMRLVIGMH